jgi:hypothetical protein
MCVDETMHAPLSISPAFLPGISAGLAAALACGGAILWLSGAVWSRSIITLTLVATGTWIGMRMPGWCGSHIDGMAPAIGGAIVLGASGYLLHRAWIGIVLALMLAAWAGAGTWMWMDWQSRVQTAMADHLEAPRETVSVSATSTLAAAKSLVESHLADNALAKMAYQFVCTGKLAVGAAVVGLLVGAMIAVRWARLSGALAWSLLGLTLALLMGVNAVGQARPTLLARIPEGAIPQAAGLVVLAAIGTALQYYLAGGGPTAQAAANDEDGED